MLEKPWSCLFLLLKGHHMVLECGEHRVDLKLPFIWHVMSWQNIPFDIFYTVAVIYTVTPYFPYQIICISCFSYDKERFKRFFSFWKKKNVRIGNVINTDAISRKKVILLKWHFFWQKTVLTTFLASFLCIALYLNIFQVIVIGCCYYRLVALWSSIRSIFCQMSKWQC